MHMCLFEGCDDADSLVSIVSNWKVTSDSSCHEKSYTCPPVMKNHCSGGLGSCLLVTTAHCGGGLEGIGGTCMTMVVGTGGGAMVTPDDGGGPGGGGGW